MIAAASADPTRLVIGVDANAEGMVATARRAAKPVARGGLPNALFVASAVETLPAELAGVADEVTINFPWGSLLRGLLTPAPEVLSAVVRTMKPGAYLRVLFSVTAHNGLAGLSPVDHAEAVRHLTAPYAAAGLRITEVRSAGTDDITAASSSWGKRLRAGAQRPAWRLCARRGE